MLPVHLLEEYKDVRIHVAFEFLYSIDRVGRLFNKRLQGCHKLCVVDLDWATSQGISNDLFNMLKWGLRLVSII